MSVNQIEKAANKESHVGLEISISGAIDTVFGNVGADDIRFQNEDIIKNSQDKSNESLRELQSSSNIEDEGDIEQNELEAGSSIENNINQNNEVI